MRGSVTLTGGAFAAAGLFWWFGVRPLHARLAEESLNAGLDAVPPATEIRAGPSVAALPFVNLSADPDQEYFADGLAEELTDLLARVPGLHVAGRTSSFAFKGKNEDRRTIGQKLNVATVLEGSVRKAGDRVRVTVQLINAADGYHLWSETYDRRLTDIFALQDEIAGAVVQALKLKLLPNQPARQRADSRAYERYLIGQSFLQRGSLEGYERAESELREALAIQPDLAIAWGGLAQARYWLANFEPESHPHAQWIAAARQAAEKAVQFGPNEPEAWSARAMVRFYVDFDWGGAHGDVERALQLAPGRGDLLAQSAYIEAAVGRLHEGVALARQSVDRDPLQGSAWAELSWLLLRAGDLAGAEQAARRALELQPDELRGTRMLGYALVLQHRLAEARALYASRPAIRDSVFRWQLEIFGGTQAEVERGLREIVKKTGAEFQEAEAWAFTGDRDRAFAVLDRAVALRDGGIIYLRYDPFLANLRADARYAALLRRLNLPETAPATAQSRP